MTELQKAVGKLLESYNLEDVELFVDMVKDDVDLENAPADVLKEIFHTIHEETLFDAIKHYHSLNAKDIHRIIYIIQNLDDLDKLKEEDYQSFVGFIAKILKNLDPLQDNMLNIAYYHGIVDIFRLMGPVPYDNNELYKWIANAIYNKNDYDKVEYFIKFNS